MNIPIELGRNLSTDVEKFSIQMLKSNLDNLADFYKRLQDTLKPTQQKMEVFNSRLEAIQSIKTLIEQTFTPLSFDEVRDPDGITKEEIDKIFNKSITEGLILAAQKAIEVTENFLNIVKKEIALEPDLIKEFDENLTTLLRFKEELQIDGVQYEKILKFIEEFKNRLIDVLHFAGELVDGYQRNMIEAAEQSSLEMMKKWNKICDTLPASDYKEQTKYSYNNKSINEFELKDIKISSISGHYIQDTLLLFNMIYWSVIPGEKDEEDGQIIEVEKVEAIEESEEVNIKEDKKDGEDKENGKDENNKKVEMGENSKENEKDNETDGEKDKNIKENEINQKGENVETIQESEIKESIKEDEIEKKDEKVETTKASEIEENVEENQKDKK